MKKKTQKINKKQFKGKATSQEYHNLHFRIRHAVKYIDKNYTDKDLSLEKIASAVQLTPNYFSGLWNKTMEVGLTEHINDLRIKKAKDLLENSPLSVVKVARKVGLKRSNFNKVFRSTTGISPTQYRKR